MTFELVRNAKVSVEHKTVELQRTRRGSNRTERPVAVITVNDRFTHTFPPDSRVSKSLDDDKPAALAARLTGGHYFFLNEKLIDFRYGDYDGFVHDDQSIDKLMDVLGFSESKTFGKGIRTMKGNTVSIDTVLGRAWSNHGIVVPGYKEGGEFNSQLLFVWNPFVRTINTFFQLVRLICTNGMVGLTTFLNRRVPLINRWEENLEIANRQIQNKVDDIAIRRFKQMGTERASVAEVMHVARHIENRCKEIERLAEASDESIEELMLLQRIWPLVDVYRQLGQFYKDEVFYDKRVAAQMPAHLTTFDVYNLATEVRSHTTEAPDSTDNALDKLANALLFSRVDLVNAVTRFGSPTLSTFSDPDTAFYGKLN